MWNRNPAFSSRNGPGGIIRAKLALLGLEEREVLGDGNCQYRAGSHQLYGTEDRYPYIRQQVLAELRAHPWLYRSDVLRYRGALSYRRFLDITARNRSWGCIITLRAAAQIFGIRIDVVTDDAHSFGPSVSPFGAAGSVPRFTVTFSVSHYNSTSRRLCLNSDVFSLRQVRLQSEDELLPKRTSELAIEKAPKRKKIDGKKKVQVRRIKLDLEAPIGCGMTSIMPPVIKLEVIRFCFSSLQSTITSGWQALRNIPVAPRVPANVCFSWQSLAYVHAGTHYNAVQGCEVYNFRTGNGTSVVAAFLKTIVGEAPADLKKPLYLQFARLEDYGLAKRDEAEIPNYEKMSMYAIYIVRAAEIFGIPKTREICEQDIARQVPRSTFSDPCSDTEFWSTWHEFEVQHGNADTFREMLPIKWSFSASYSQGHVVSAVLTKKDTFLRRDEYNQLLYISCASACARDTFTGIPGQKVLISNSESAMQPLLPAIWKPDRLWSGKQTYVTCFSEHKDQRLSIDEAKDKLKLAGDEIAALERYLAPDTHKRKMGFVSAGVESPTRKMRKVTSNHEEPEESDLENEKSHSKEEDIELPEGSDLEDEKSRFTSRRH